MKNQWLRQAALFAMAVASAGWTALAHADPAPLRQVAFEQIGGASGANAASSMAGTGVAGARGADWTGALFPPEGQGSFGPGGYIGWNAGIGVAGDVSFAGTTTGPEGSGALPFASDSDLDVGWQFALTLGANDFIAPNWRGEVEVLYTNNETDDAEDNFDDIFDTGDEGQDVDFASADVSVFGGFANLLFDFAEGARVRPYLGAGIGYGRLDVEYGPFEAQDEVFLWQAKAGVSVPFTDSSSLEIGYRYLDAESASFDEGDLDFDVTGEVETSVHAITIGARYRFGG